MKFLNDPLFGIFKRPLVMLAIFLPLSISGYLFYGSTVESNILRRLSSGPLLTAVNVLMATHVFAAFLIAINPVNLLIEDYLKFEHCKYGSQSVFFSIKLFSLLIQRSIGKDVHCAHSLDSFVSSLD